ncbi:MAG: ATP-dependent metallopeptidase FtsH/Yme1/Tma family protein, partial [Frisingicoccus sp.]|nr:ATP-dependent metallopeptidase FtsH/Yme1/Tma family protein [Frisingicoccus sp.]
MEDNNRNSKNDNKKNANNKKNMQNLIVIMLTAIMAVVMINMLLSQMKESRREEVPYNEFLTMVDDGEVVKAEIKYDTIEFWKDDSPMAVTYWTGKVAYDGLTERLEAGGVEFKNEVTDSSDMIFSFFMSYIFPILLTFAMLMWVMKSMKGGNMMGVGKSNAKTYMQSETGITFKDVAGQEESKESLTEIVDFLHNPAKYTQIGAKLPKGALLVGPPGTGKTLLAKAVAGEAKVPFYSLTGSDFVEMFVGVGASRVRDLFKKAQETAPCIIFIDELDAIGKSRDSRFGGNDEREQTLNQLLSEMDGFDSSKGIIVLAATNRPEILDKALLRPGRFDRRIIVEKPDFKGRVDILKVHARHVRIDETVDFDEIARATSGAVGSDLANIINEAALLAVRKGRNAVSQEDLFESVEVVIAGKEKKDRILSQQERKIV